MGLPQKRKGRVTRHRSSAPAEIRRDDAPEGSPRPARPISPLRRRGLRTWLLSLAGICLLGGAAVVVLLKNLGPPAEAPGEGVGRNEDGGAGGGDRRDIRGTIGVRPELEARAQGKAALFIIVRDAAGSLVAVRRVLEPQFPLRYRIGPEDAMISGTLLQGSVQVSARLSQSGRAGPAEPGDLEGEHPARVQAGEGQVDITLSRVR